MKKRVLSMLLTCAMGASLIAGCGGSGSSNETAGNDTAAQETADTASEEKAEATEDAGEAESTEEAAESTDAAASGDVVTLKWVTIGSGMPDNYDSWAATLNEYLAEKIGVNIEMEVISWGDWDNRRNIIISTNEPYDIIFGNGGNFTSDVALGAYYDISDLVKDNMPGLTALMPETYWDAVTVDGKVYGVPTYKDSSLSNYDIWDAELVDEYSLDIDDLAKSLDAKTEIFTQLKADKNDYPVYVKNDGLYYIFDKYDQLGAGLQILGVRYDDKDAKVCLTLEQDDIFSELKTIHQWYEDGIINSDASTLSEGRVYNMWRVAQGWPSAAVTAWGPQMGKDVKVSQIGETILSNDTVRGSLNMVSANTQYPEKCLQFLDLVNTDTKVRDLFYYGEEGVNFQYTADGKVEKLNEDWTMAGYTQGTFFTVTQNAADEFNQWDEVKELNENATPSVLLGFTFDTTEVSDQLANCTEIWSRYKSEVITGVQDPETAVPEIKAELEAAGWDELVAAAQAQVDEFMASK
ncbi:ABC transporter substrate-binding protein [Butyrivibrio sp. WCD3002]|uniref:ABC transporter substrate-binding protein n=1 Tax=Butyrivibrio sp. WCD3002 TaxID=1280676 RepID=UPI00041BB081|nr:ABC transporter substrate-binding protein [Butyrivibrio sp. WCD3002]